jgi:hypothetical protein
MRLSHVQAPETVATLLEECYSEKCFCEASDRLSLSEILRKSQPAGRTTRRDSTHSAERTLHSLSVSQKIHP